MENFQVETKHLLEKSIKRESTAVLVVNTHSRRGQRLFFAAADELAKKGISVTASYPIRYPERLPEIVQEAVKQSINIFE